MIPKGWELKKLDDIAEFENGKAHENVVSEDGKFILVTSKFVSSNGKDFRRTDAQLSPLKKYQITLVMSDIPNGKALAKCFYINKNDTYTLNQRICALTIKSDHPKFIFYLLNRNKYYLEFDNGVGQTNLRKQEVLDCPVLVPPIGEQEKISNILSTWDEAIEKTEKLLTVKDLEFTWFINKAIAKSKDYPLMAIDDLFEVGRGRVISKGEIQKNFGEYPVYSSQTSNDGIFGYLNTYDFDGEYLTWTTDGANAGAVFHRTGKFNCTNVCGTLKQKYKDISPLFVSYLLRNITPKHVSKNLANPKLMNGVMKAIKINVPPLDFQNSAAKIFQTKKQEIDLVIKKIGLLKLQKQGLMQQLLTGKKRVKV